MATPRRRRAAVRPVAIVAGLLGLVAAADACTRILWNTNDLAVVSARSMDWPESTVPVLTVFPRGITRDGGVFGDQVLDDVNPARWTSRHGSVVTTIYGVGTIDGMNEKGLGVHLNYLAACDFGPRDTTRSGLQAGLWGQYLLDNAATVEEALELMKGVQPLKVSAFGHEANVHLALEDATGDSAVIQYLEGRPVVHHGHEHRVMTNDPPYPEQLEYLSRYDFTDATRQTDLPGNVDPRHRLVRATYFLNFLPEPADERAAIAGVLAIARNCSVPFGAPNNAPGSLYNTEYRTAMNLTTPRYYFELADAPNLIWTTLADHDFSEGAPVKVFDPNKNPLAAGDVTAAFEKAAEIPF